ncbi:MAG: hypothetical protein ACTSRW_11450 [Candidatus Helarchaeota archaeon]
MTLKNYKVVKCEECSTLTLKRASVKKPTCPHCQAKGKFIVIAVFETATEATSYIQQQKRTSGSREFHFGKVTSE